MCDDDSRIAPPWRLPWLVFGCVPALLAGCSTTPASRGEEIGQALPPEQRAELTVEVVDQFDRPVEGARVRWGGATDADDPTVSGVTNAHGVRRLRFPPSDAGDSRGRDVIVDGNGVVELLADEVHRRLHGRETSVSIRVTRPRGALGKLALLWSEPASGRGNALDGNPMNRGASDSDWPPDRTRIPPEVPEAIDLSEAMGYSVDLVRGGPGWDPVWMPRDIPTRDRSGVCILHVPFGDWIVIAGIPGRSELHSVEFENPAGLEGYQSTRIIELPVQFGVVKGVGLPAGAGITLFRRGRSDWGGYITGRPHGGLGRTAFAEAGRDGEFMVGNVVPGHYEVAITAANRSVRVRPIVVSDGQKTLIDPSPLPLGRMRFHVPENDSGWRSELWVREWGAECPDGVRMWRLVDRKSDLDAATVLSTSVAAGVVEWCWSGWTPDRAFAREAPTRRVEGSLHVDEGETVELRW